MNQKSELLHFYDNYYNSIKSLETKDSFADKFYQSFLAGENELYQKFISETRVFDEKWIKTVESYVPSLNKIVLNPRSSVKLQEEVVAVERAKRITSESVKHLASNTHFIKEVRQSGEVIPKRILTSYSEIDYGTYENRFIMTLIERLFVFVRSRYEVIKTNIESFEKRRFHLKSSFPINQTNVDLEVNFTLVDESENKEINEFNKKLLKRVEYLNKIVTSLRSSSFMELMKEYKRIYPPIMKTNVIQKNVDFRNAYLLWLFIDRYNTLAFTTEIEEKDLTFTDHYYDDINRQVLTLYSSIVRNQEMNKKEYENIIPKKFRRKSIKITRSHPDDIHLTPEDEVIEDQTLNEYYLNQNKQIFKQSLEYHQEEASSYEVSVKRALRETLNISNALYESFFELEENDDIFTRLIKEVDVTKELAEARRKLLISKMIREVKAVDFNNSLRQERKFLDEIAKYDGLLLKEYEQKLELSKKEIKEKERLEKDRKQALLDKEIVEEQLKENKFLSEEINKYRIEINKKINDYQRELNKKLIEEEKKYTKELEDETTKYLKEYKEKYAPKRGDTLKILKEEQKKIDTSFKEEKETLLKTHEVSLEKSKKDIEKAESLVKKEKETALKEEIVELKRLEKEFLDEEVSKYQQQIDDKTVIYQEGLAKEKLKEEESYQKELKLKADQALKEYKEKHAPKRKVTLEALSSEKLKLDERFNQSKLKLDTSNKEELKGIKLKLKEASDLRVKEDKDKYKEMYLANERNVNELKKHREKTQQALKTFKENLKTQSNLELSTFKDQLLKEEYVKIGSLRQYYKITNRVTNHKLNQEIKKLDARLEKEKKRLIEFERQKQLKKRVTLKEKSAQKVLKEKESNKALYDANEKNIKALEMAKKKHKESIDKLKK